MATEDTPTWEAIVENCTNDAGCTPAIRQLVRALAVHLRHQQEEAEELRRQVELQAKQIEYLRARARSDDWCGFWDEFFPTA